jgi:hypothetical protein
VFLSQFIEVLAKFHYISFETKVLAKRFVFHKRGFSKVGRHKKTLVIEKLTQTEDNVDYC